MGLTEDLSFTYLPLLPILVILNFCFDNLMGREEQVSKFNLTQGDSPTIQLNYILNVRANQK